MKRLVFFLLVSFAYIQVEGQTCNCNVLPIGHVGSVERQKRSDFFDKKYAKIFDKSFQEQTYPVASFTSLLEKVMGVKDFSGMRVYFASTTKENKKQSLFLIFAPTHKTSDADYKDSIIYYIYDTQKKDFVTIDSATAKGYVDLFKGGDLKKKIDLANTLPEGNTSSMVMASDVIQSFYCEITKCSKGKFDAIRPILSSYTDEDQKQHPKLFNQRVVISYSYIKGNREYHPDSDKSRVYRLDGGDQDSHLPCPPDNSCNGASLY